MLNKVLWWRKENLLKELTVFTDVWHYIPFGNIKLIIFVEVYPPYQFPGNMFLLHLVGWTTSIMRSCPITIRTSRMDHNWTCIINCNPLSKCHGTTPGFPSQWRSWSWGTSNVMLMHLVSNGLISDTLAKCRSQTHLVTCVHVQCLITWTPDILP